MVTTSSGFNGTLVYENDDVELIPQFSQKGYRTIPIIYINGQKVGEGDAKKARPNQTLLSFLREVMKLTGTKLGCGEGGCGACTVMISRFDDELGKVVHYSANACLMPVLATDGCHVTTVEGLGKASDDNLHPIQKAMVDMHGSQCGFCTPGIIVAIYSLLANNPTTKYLEEHLDGNLCRCTGYRPIWDAARSLCTDAITGPCGTPCNECPERDSCKMECNVESKETENIEAVSKMCCSSSKDKILEYSTNESFSKNWMEKPNEMFPDSLKSPPTTPLIVVDNMYHSAGTWIKALTLDDLLSLLKRFNGNCKIVVGNTEIGIETKFKHSVYPRLIMPSPSIKSLFTISKSDQGLAIGSCVPLSSIQKQCEVLVNESSQDFQRLAKPISQMLRWFASTQIRNVACLGGNLATASPISDMNPMLACLNAKLIIVSTNSPCAENESTVSIERRNVPVSEFFVGYRKVALQPHELIESIFIPKPRSVFEYSFPFKQAKRREDDISIVTAGMRIIVRPSGETFVIDQVSLAFGGMAPRTILATKTVEFLTGKVFCKDTFHTGRSVLLKELALPDDVPGGQSHFRKTLACSFLYRLYLMTSKAISEDLTLMKENPQSYLDEYINNLPPAPHIDDRELSATTSFVDQRKPSIKGIQRFPSTGVAVGLEGIQAHNQRPGKEIVGKEASHSSAPLHCTGEAVYTDDIPMPPNTLHAALILSTTCNAKLLSIDKTKALLTPDVVAVYTHEDVEALGGNNTLGFSPIGHDEYIFLPKGETVSFVGQVIGICVAKTVEASETGARSVQMKYSEIMGKPVVSIGDAIESKSYFEAAIHAMKRSDNIEVLDNDRVINVSGTFRCGGQEHFYLETNSSLVIPSEGLTNMTIYTSTQAVNKTQMFCAAATNTPASKVVVKMKRMGGGFGGKETRSVPITCAAAVAAKRSELPVKLTLPRDVDMIVTGGRHAFVAKYDASAIIKKDSTVKLHSMKVELFNNGGAAADLSGPVMDRALFHLDNCYYWPKFDAVGSPCKTAQAPHTAFRGFGGPQGLATCEHIIEHLAVECNVFPEDIRRQNMYQQHHSTPFGMIMNEKQSGKWNVPNMYDKLCHELDVPSKRNEIKAFNEKNKFLKRGMAIIPTKFGIAFTAKFMNQGGALVHLYTDGTVLVSHGGTEMGQGLHTKVCQVAAQAFNIPLCDVYVNDTSSDKVANSIPTAASMSTDMYGMATLNACRQILERISPIREKLPADATLSQVATKAFYERIDLSAHGFFALDDSRCGFDWALERPENFPLDKPENSWKGQPFNYFTQGVAFAEVEIDVLTGNHRTLRSDVLVDVGCSINPALDIGQIEGAFIQGMGWCTLEEMIYGDDQHLWVRPKGRTFTTGPGTYKIPAFNDVPEIFNVSLMDNVENPFAVHSSKAVGEPPFFLGCSVFFALRDAIKAVRCEKGVVGHFELRMPATSERIRMACLDDIAVECISSSEDSSLDKLLIAEKYQPKGSH